MFLYLYPKPSYEDVFGFKDSNQFKCFVKLETINLDGDWKNNVLSLK